MASWLRKPRTAEPYVPTDTVIPVRFFDDTVVFRMSFYNTMFVFDDVLAPEKLRCSLEEVINRDGWRKLGARLRINDKSELQYHIPATFTPLRPAVEYTHIQHGISVSEHLLASRLPKPTPRPAILCDNIMNELSNLARAPNAPSKLDHYLYEDRPQLGLHVASFTDTTLVGLHWPHTAFDAVGKHELLKAWVSTLQGRGDEINTPFGCWERGENFDPLRTLGQHPTEPHRLAGHHLGIPGQLLFMLRYAFTTMLREKQCRVICLPGVFVERLHVQAMHDLAAAALGNTEERPFVSENDVLSAWLTRLAISHIPAHSKRTVAIQQACNVRKVLEQDLLSPGRPYVSSALVLLYTLLPACDILTQPLGLTALAIRRSIVEQRTRSQVEAYSALQRNTWPPNSKMMPLFGDCGMFPVPFSNWGQADLFGVDFAAAREHPHSEKTLFPSYVQAMSNSMGEGFYLIGKDAKRNIWLGASMVKSRWPDLEKAFAETEFEIKFF